MLSEMTECSSVFDLLGGIWGGGEDAREAFLGGHTMGTDDQGNGRKSGGVVGRGPGEKSLPVRVHGPGATRSRSSHCSTLAINKEGNPLFRQW